MSAVLILFKRRPGAGTLRSAGSTPPAKSRGCSLCAHSRPRRIECVLRRAFAVFGCSECRREPFLDRTKVEQKKKKLFSHGPAHPRVSMHRVCRAGRAWRWSDKSSCLVACRGVYCDCRSDAHAHISWALVLEETASGKTPWIWSDYTTRPDGVHDTMRDCAILGANKGRRA